MSNFRSTDNSERARSTPQREANGFERALSYAAAAIAISSFVSMMALLIAPLMGVDFASAPAGLWPVVMTVAYYGFPIAFVCVVVLIISNVVNNRRSNNNQHANDTT